MNTENKIQKGSKENFDPEYLVNPTKMIKDIALYFLFLLIKVCLFGYIIYFTYKQTGLMNETSIVNYFLFLIIGSIVLYIVTFLYFMYKCYNRDVKFSEMDYKGYAISSVLGPSFILSYTIFILVANNLKTFVPGIGRLVYLFIYFSFLVVITTGMAYNYTFEFAYMLTKCKKE